MSDQIHPHWNTTDGLAAPSVTVPSLGPDPIPLGTTVSRRPAAVFGILAALALGYVGYSYYGSDTIIEDEPALPAQVVPMDTSSSFSSFSSVASSLSSSSVISSRAALSSSQPALLLVSSFSSLSRSSASSSSSLAAVAASSAPAPLPAAIPVNVNTVTTQHGGAPLLPQTAPVAVLSGKGKGKPPSQPTTGFPLWLAAAFSFGGMELLTRRHSRRHIAHT